MSIVGIDLRSPVFSHGQLYVALSRCTSANRIKVLFPNESDTTKLLLMLYIREVLSGLNIWSYICIMGLLIFSIFFLVI